MSTALLARCECGLPRQAVASRTDPANPRLSACGHCDAPCPRKTCARCKKAGVKR